MEKDLYGYETTLAMANISGSNMYPEIKGRVIFKKKDEGVLVTAEIIGLPHSNERCDGRIFAFHIHDGNSCSGNQVDSFADVGSHYNPNGCNHPYHDGDLPPLFENNGYAYMSVYTNRFTIGEIIGRTVIIHDMPDDFKTQPSGGSGNKIACGKISAV